MKFVFIIALILGTVTSLRSQDLMGSDFTNELEPLGDGLWKFQYEVKDYLNKKLVVEGSEIGIFLNNDLVKVSDRDTLLLDQLGSGRILLHFTSDKSIKASLLEPVLPSAIQATPNPRLFKSYFNFTSVFFSVSLLFLAIIKWTQGRDFNEYLRVSRMFAPRNADENILRNKLMTNANLQYLLFFNLIVSGSMVCYENLTMGTVQDQWMIFLRWLGYYGLFGSFLMGKWLLISFINYIFNFHAFLQSHLVNYLRISSFFALIWTLVLLGFSWWNPAAFPSEVFVLSVFISALIRILILFLKLNSTEGYRGFHLFSYLCATEIIPFLGVIYFTSEFFQ